MIRLKDTKTTPHGHVQLLCALRAEDHIIPHIEKAPEIGKKEATKEKKLMHLKPQRQQTQARFPTSIK